MPNIRTTLATLVAGGVVGIASQASAATVVTLNIADSDSTTNIKLAGSSTAQFSYGADALKDTYLTALGSSRIGTVSTSNAFPVAGETYTSTSLDTATYIFPVTYDPNFNSDVYAHISFAASGIQYVGLATITKAATLTTIAYEKASDLTSGVPEPESWALLLAGFGVIGASLRQRRRQPAAVTA